MGTFDIINEVLERDEFKEILYNLFCLEKENLFEKNCIPTQKGKNGRDKQAF